MLAPENSAWNYRTAPFRLPPLTRIMLADVDAGSDTPSFVGKVLAWRRNDPSNGQFQSPPTFPPSPFSLFSLFFLFFFLPSISPCEELTIGNEQ